MDDDQRGVLRARAMADSDQALAVAMDEEMLDNMIEHWERTERLLDEFTARGLSRVQACSFVVSAVIGLAFPE